MNKDFKKNIQTRSEIQTNIDNLMISDGIPRNLDKIKEKVSSYLDGSGYSVVYNIIKTYYGV